MPKHKPKRGTPLIDMTAMTDVAFLLLTFFMLSAKAKPDEVAVVDTPSSVSETKLPDAGTLNILIDKDGKVFLDPKGTHSRKELIERINAEFNLGLTEEEKLRFSTAGGFGLPKNKIKGWLNMPPAERKHVAMSGIPCDTVDNQLAPWIHNARLAQFMMKQQGVVNDEYVIVIKADQNTPYPNVQQVINTLTDINVNKFNLITTMESDPNKKHGEGHGGGEK